MNPLSGLNEEGKEKALDYIQLLVDSGKFQNATIIPFRRKIRLFDIPASAGVGNFLDGDNFTEVEVDEETREKVEKLYELLEDIDDVQSVYCNIKEN